MIKLEEALQSKLIDLPKHNSIQDRVYWLMEQMKNRIKVPDDLSNNELKEWMRNQRIFRRLVREENLKVSFEQYLKMVEVAKECHIANNNLMVTNNEIPNPIDWNDLSTHTKHINISSVKKIYDNPSITAKDIHDEWMKNKIKDGWKYGDVKDDELKTHHLIVDFDKMNDVDKMKDQIFIDIVNNRRDFIGNM